MSIRCDEEGCKDFGKLVSPSHVLAKHGAIPGTVDTGYKRLVAGLRNGRPPFNRRDKSRDAATQWLAFDRVYNTLSASLLENYPQAREQLYREVYEGA